MQDEIGENEVKKWVSVSSQVLWNHRKLRLTLGPEKVHEPSITTIFVIPLVAGRSSVEDGWTSAAGKPRPVRVSPVKRPFNVISVHLGRMR